MLRVTEEETSDGMVIKVEGRLAGELVNEVERTWNKVSPAGRGEHVVVDLCGVTFIDAQGKKLLRRMHREGTQFRCCGPDIRATIETIKNEK